MENYITQKDIRGFYLARFLEGKSYHLYQILNMFRAKHTYTAWFRKYASYDHTEYSTNIYGNAKQTSYFKIRKCFLVEKDKIKRFITLKGANNPVYYRSTHRITGTSLAVYHDDQEWWKYKEFGMERDWLPEDIEVHHINENIKLRDATIKFLEVVKQEPFKTFNKGFI